MRTTKILLLVFSAASIVLYAGAFYGWGPMQLLLEGNGSYSNQCPSPDVVCEAQTAALLNVRLVSQLTVLSGPMLGWFSDRFGPTRLVVLFTLQAISGMIFLLFAAEYEGTLDWMLYVAFICLGFASTSGGLLSVVTGMVFQGRTRNRVISALNALYDTGAVVYLGLWGIGEASGASLTVLTAGYLGLGVLILGGFCVCFYRLVQEQLEIDNEKKAVALGVTSNDDDPSKGTEPLDVESISGKLNGTTSSHLPVQNLNTPECSALEMKEEEKESPNATISTNDNDAEIPPEPPTQKNPGGPSDDEQEINDEPSTKLEDSSLDTPGTITTLPEAALGSREAREEESESYIVISERAVSQQIRSRAFVMLCLFFSYQVMSNVWTLTTARDFLKQLGDDEYGNRYLTIFTLMTPISLLGLPFVDHVMHKHGFHIALQVVNTLAMANGIIKVASDNLNVQIFGFLIFSFFRCFLFSVSFSCLASFMSGNAMGRATGIFYTSAGVLCFFNIPLANIAIERLGGDFFIPNLVVLLLNIPIVYVTWIIGKSLKIDQREKECLQRVVDQPPANAA